MKRASSVDVELGARLRAFRKSLRVNQTKLGATVGLTFQQIQKYERGDNRISAATLFEFAHALGVDINQFFVGLKPKTRKLKAERPKPKGRSMISTAEPRNKLPGMARDSKAKGLTKPGAR